LVGSVTVTFNTTAETADAGTPPTPVTSTVSIPSGSTLPIGPGPDQHLTGCGEAADARGDVDGAAVDVVVVADDVAGVEAEMEGKAGVVPSLAAGQRGLDRLAGGGEDGEDAIAEELAFDGGASVIADDGAEIGVEIAGLRAEGGVAEALGEGGGVGDVDR